MPQFALLSSRTPNIGDEIQHLAAAQFLPKIDHYIPRDRLSEAAKLGDIFVILNGWFMHTPYEGSWQMHRPLENLAHIAQIARQGALWDWPPPPNVKPLFISFHARSRAIVHPGLRAYFKKFEPIGCRDHFTLKLFQAIGVEAYFSGCLTLTFLPVSLKREGPICFVDPFGPCKNMWSTIPRPIRDNALHLTHACYERDPLLRFKKARELLGVYATARLVVTSRLHCALPCLAFGTPVIFVHPGNEDIRFSGSLELLRKYSFDELHRGAYDIDWDHPQANPVDVSALAKSLRERCQEAVGAYSNN